MATSVSQSVANHTNTKHMNKDVNQDVTNEPITVVRRFYSEMLFMCLEEILRLRMKGLEIMESGWKK